MIMEDVIYGVMLSAKMENWSNPPPVKAFRKLNASFVLFAKYALKYYVFTPGTGIWEPRRITHSIRRTYRIL